MACALLLCLGLAGPAMATTAAADAVASADDVLTGARQTLEDIQKQLDGDTTDDALVELRTSALQVQAQAEQVAADLAPALTKVQARLAELGPAPTAKGVVEAADIAGQRASMAKDQQQLDAQLKLARLLSVEGAQAADQLADRRRAQFTAQIGERTASILAPPFWRELRANRPRDLGRLEQMSASLATAARATAPGVWAVLLLGAVAVIGLRFWVVHLLLRFTAARVPAGRLRRSLMALVLTLLNVAAPTVAALLLRAGFTWEGKLSDALDQFLLGGVGMVCFGAYVAGLGDALLSTRRPSWRLPPLSDGVAGVLALYPPLLAIVLVAGWVMEQLTALLNTGLATAVAFECMTALLMGFLLAHGMRRAEHRHRAELAAAQPTPAVPAAVAPGSVPWATLGATLVWVVLGLSLACLLVGYVAIGSFVVKQIAWIATVVASVYLINALIDDVFVAWLGSPRGTADLAGEDTATRMRAQGAVLLSALGRLLVLLVALVLVAAPFGQGPLDLAQRAAQLRDGIAIGEVRLQPGTVLQALAVFVIGVIVVRLLQRWLRDRFLPTTGLDPAMRDSATTLLGYVGSIGAFALALSAIGLGLERIAWVASALSVGIGFGLQAVVSNFVSGLILLAERPVKVGDWVSLGGVEGDIRRINVRATEIQMGDRSTVIVPNSEFITKTVRNVTLGSPLGQVTIKFPMPLDTDVERVREVVLGAFNAHEGVLDNPGPSVFLDGIEGGMLVFNATGSVSSPRQSYGVKSALLYEILRGLREAGLPMSASKPQMVLREVAAPTASSPAA
jgi:small-conductance mechanosensitive channel